MKNSAGRGDLQNSSYPKKAEFNNCLLFIQNIFKLLKEKMIFTVNSFAPVHPFFSPQRKTIVKLPLTPLYLQDF